MAIYDDNGISGAKGREYRVEFDKLLKGAVRREIDLVAAWSVNRLGRSLQDLISFLQELHGSGCRSLLTPAVAGHNHTQWESHVPDDGGLC